MIRDLRIYGAQYKLWRDGKYIGIGTWTDDENVGESFISKTDGENFVYIADEWQLIPKT